MHCCQSWNASYRLSEKRRFRFKGLLLYIFYQHNYQVCRDWMVVICMHGTSQPIVRIVAKYMFATTSQQTCHDMWEEGSRMCCVASMDRCWWYAKNRPAIKDLSETRTWICFNLQTLAMRLICLDMIWLHAPCSTKYGFQNRFQQTDHI